MIIDIHTHFWGRGFIPKAIHRITAQAWADKEPGRDPEMILPKIEEGLVDPDGELFIRHMNRAGVDTSFIMAADFGIHWSGEEPSRSMEEQLIYYAVLQKKFPGRLYAFAFVDPRRPGATELFERAIKEWGLKGCGEFTCKDISVADDVSQPLIRKCADLGVPLLIHSRDTVGTEVQGDFTVTNVSHPSHAETVLQRYPGLKVIIAHAGYPIWWERAAFIASRHPNCYLDLSNWHQEIGDPANLIPKLACMRDMIGADHMCFGTDQDSGRRHCGENSVLMQWLKFMRELPQRAKECGYFLGQKELDLILGGTARKLFDL
jgi:predicted TIM-barrel fold metal-dependent hydrolase